MNIIFGSCEWDVRMAPGAQGRYLWRYSQSKRRCVTSDVQSTIVDSSNMGTVGGSWLPRSVTYDYLRFRTSSSRNLGRPLGQGAIEDVHKTIGRIDVYIASTTKTASEASIYDSFGGYIAYNWTNNSQNRCVKGSNFRHQCSLWFLEPFDCFYI